MTRRMTKKLLRPRWIAVGLLVAVTAAAAALVGTTTATSADAIPFSNPAHPVIDANWIYDHNFFESNQFIYKVAGSDGCLPSATTCAPGGGTRRRQQQPAPELQRRAGVLRLVEGRRHDAHPAAERQARSLGHRAGPPLPDAQLAAERRRADDPGRGLRGPAGDAREPQRLDADRDEPGQRRHERQPHADEHDALGQLGQRLGLRRQHGREHEPGGDRVGAPLA